MLKSFIFGNKRWYRIPPVAMCWKIPKYDFWKDWQHLCWWKKVIKNNCNTDHKFTIMLCIILLYNVKGYIYSELIIELNKIVDRRNSTLIPWYVNPYVCEKRQFLLCFHYALQFTISTQRLIGPHSLSYAFCTSPPICLKVCPTVVIYWYFLSCLLHLQSVCLPVFLCLCACMSLIYV